MVNMRLYNNIYNVKLFNLIGVVSKRKFEGRYGSKALFYLNFNDEGEFSILGLAEYCLGLSLL